MHADAGRGEGRQRDLLPVAVDNELERSRHPFEIFRGSDRHFLGLAIDVDFNLHDDIAGPQSCLRRSGARLDKVYFHRVTLKREARGDLMAALDHFMPSSGRAREMDGRAALAGDVAIAASGAQTPHASEGDAE